VNQSSESQLHERAAQLIPWLVNATLSVEEATRLRAHLATCAKCRTDFEVEQRLYESIRTDGPLVFTGESSFEKLMARIESERELVTEETATAPSPMSAVSAGGPPETFGSLEPFGASETLRSADLFRFDATGGRMPPRHTRRRAPTPTGRRPRRAPARWLTAAVLVEAVALTLGVFLWHRAERAPAAGYVTLSDPAVRYGEGARVRAVFSADLTLDGLQRLLRATGAHIIDGPSDARVYTLGFAEPRPSSAQLTARLATLRADPHVLFAEVASEASPR
jgi:Putative zinc-finger